MQSYGDFQKNDYSKRDFSNNIIVKANPTRWITKDMFLEWLYLVSSKRKCVILLIYDSALSHLAEDVKKLIKKYSKISVILGGLTKFSQPLDLTFNGALESKIKNF